MKQILLVDDDPAMNDAIHLVFDPKLYEVTIDNSGHQLLHLKESLPDLILMDKQLSGLDGLFLCRFIKSQTHLKHIPVIMLSASPHIKPLAAAAGADEAIEKPFSVRVLRQMADRLLKR